MFKIDYQITDYTLDPPPVMLFKPEEQVMVSIPGAIYGILPKAYQFTIQVGDYCYSVERARIHAIAIDLERVIKCLLGLEPSEPPLAVILERKHLPLLEEQEQMVALSLYYQFIDDVPIWNFVFEPNKDTVKIYPRFYQGIPETAQLVPLLPPWTVAPEADPQQPPILCSKKQIVSELYQLYLKLVQDAQKMYPDQFADADYLGAAYEDWKEQMKTYRVAIQAL